MSRRGPVQYEVRWSYSPISGPVVGTLGAVCVALFGQVVTEFPVWAPCAIAGTGIAAAAALAYFGKAKTGPMVFRSLCWGLAALWSTWIIVFGWSWGAVIALLAGGLGTVILSHLFATPGPVAGQVVQTTVAPNSSGFQDVLFAMIIKFANLKPGEYPTLTKVSDWANKTGHTWLIEAAPASALNWTRIRDIQVDLATALRLPRGCAAVAEPGPTHQGASLLKISTVNEMHIDIPFPVDGKPRSIRNEFAFGLLQDKTEAMIEIHQSSGLIAGQRGGGKTVLLQGMTASTAWCTDSIICHVDLNGGSISAPWTTPYALGEIDEPVVAWVAPTPRTALQMARVLTAIAEDRKKTYQRMMIVHDTDILPVGNGRDMCMQCDEIHPSAVTVFVDEGGEAFGEDAVPEARQAAQELRKLQRIARAMCVNVVFSVQRATSDYVSAQMKKAAGVSICTKVGDDSELAYLFDWKKGLSADNLLYPGQVYYRRGTGPLQMAKVYALKPKQITEIARATSRLRPPFDPAAVAVGGVILAERWTNPDITDYLNGLRGNKVAATPVDPDVRKWPGAAPAPGLRAAQDALDMMRQAELPDTPPVPVKPAAKPGPAGGDEWDVALSEIASLAEFDPGSLDDRRQTHRGSTEPVGEHTQQTVLDVSPAARLEFVVQLVDGAGPAGMKAEDVVKQTIAAGYTQRRQTVMDTLGTAKLTGRLQQRGGTYAMWYSSRHAAR